MNELLINAGGLVLMAAIVWWFWLAPGKSGHPTDSHHSRQDETP
ncbi:MAG: hypothetical protein R3175_12880 [Marinobacter sp.]|nr:hypothetical protein [Marinobacter sp.]MDX1756950.1 hypothetical protein [Marinobacter sp.]